MTHFTPREKLGQKIGRLPDRRQRPVRAFAAVRTAESKIIDRQKQTRETQNRFGFTGLFD